MWIGENEERRERHSKNGFQIELDIYYVYSSSKLPVFKFRFFFSYYYKNIRIRIQKIIRYVYPYSDHKLIHNRFGPFFGFNQICVTFMHLQNYPFSNLDFFSSYYYKNIKIEIQKIICYVYLYWDYKLMHNRFGQILWGSVYTPKYSLDLT